MLLFLIILIGMVNLKYFFWVVKNFLRYELFLVKMFLLKFLFIFVVLYMFVVRNDRDKIIIIILVIECVRNLV